MNRAFRIGAAVGALGLASLSGATALACGGGGVASGAGVVMGSQRVLMAVHPGGWTDVVAQITVPQTTADYGVLIPVPGEPSLDSEPVSVADLNSLDAATAPMIFREAYSHDSGCGCGSLKGGDDDDDGAATTPTHGVVVSTAVNIGPVVAVSLTGDSGDAVRAWLTENGFSLPESDVATFDRYVGEGNYFIAIRRSERAATGSPSSIGIHYKMAGDHRKLSLGFARIGAAEKLAFTLFLAAPQTIGPSEPFKTLTLSDLDGPALRRDEYPLAVEVAVAARDSKAFVLESTTPFATLFPASSQGLARFIDNNSMITRATTVVARDRLDDDVVFATQYTRGVPSQRHVSLDVVRVRYASMGSLGLLVMAGALRRRWRGSQPSGSNR